MAAAHRNNDDEWNAFVAGNASGSGVLVFGRITYEMMADYWPTPMALQTSPTVAKGMNDMQKVVFFANPGSSVLDQHHTGEGRDAVGNSEDEARSRAGHGDSGKRQHSFAAGAGKFDR